MKNRWIIPDIHGCSKTLKALVKEQIGPAKYDELYFLGDYIDRGPDSKGVIDFLMQLENEEFDVHFIIGNHEDYCIKAWEADQKKSLFGIKKTAQKEWERYGGKQTLQSFGAKKPSEIPVAYIDWMKKCKPFIELEKYILVHAGMNFNAEDPFKDTRSMMWVRDFKVDYSKTHGKKIIHGHVPVDLCFIDLLLHSNTYKFIALDNGVYSVDSPGFGNLIALNIDTREIRIQFNLDM
jgi:Calcineurin-like phosphoesterase.